ncbi:hypothetical protein BWX40_00580 [Prevotella intermedia]|nr:hypothetical protein BWX40_00580 [Prevotella intermedia]
MVNNCVVFGKNVKEMQKYWHILACLELYFYFCLYIQQIAILPLLSKSKTVFQPHRGDFKTLFEVFSFLLPMGFTDGDPR